MKIAGPRQTNELPAVAWKNGGGITRTLAVEPADTGLGDFFWRVSIADVTASGRFSSFPEVDRTIVLLEGEGMTLAGADGITVALTKPFAPYSFRGEEEITGTLIGGACRDFNVMTRRGQASAAVECLRIETRLSDNIDDAVLYCACGSFRIFPGEDTGTVISAGSVLRMSDLTSGVRMFPEQLGSVLISVCISLQVKMRNS